MKEAMGATCQVCPLFKDTYTQIRSAGSRKPKLIVVGDGPGQDDAFAKQPFQGYAGKVVRDLIEEQGLDPEQDVFFTTALLCWPRSLLAKDELRAEALEACKGRLKYVLNLFPQDIPVLVLGEWAAQVLGLELRERWEMEKLSGKSALWGVSPAWVAANPTQVVELEQIIKKVLSPRKQFVYPGSLDYILNPEVLPSLHNFSGQRIVIDIETTGLRWYHPEDQIFMAGIATKKHRLIFEDDYLARPEVQQWFRDLFELYGDQIGGHNFKFDVLFMARQLGTPVKIGWDTIAMVNSWNEHWHKGLKELSTFFFDVEDYEERLVKSFLRKIKKKADKTYDKVPRQQMREYLMNDIVYNLYASFELEAMLKEVGRWDMPYQGHEVPQVNMLAQTEMNGFVIDVEEVYRLQGIMAHEAELVRKQIEKLTDRVIENPGSPIQVKKYLFDVLKLKVKKRTPTGAPAADEDVLLQYKSYPAVEALLIWRRITKLKNSFLDNILEFLFLYPDGQHRVHASYNHWSVVTHRLSAKNPAVQTIPHSDPKKDKAPDWLLEMIRQDEPGFEFLGDYGTAIKKVYSAAPGNILITGDGKGWEMTCAAGASGDPYLVEKINSGVDVHGSFCDIIYGAGQWDKADRTREKNIYFGWQYKGSEGALSMESGLPIEKVRAVTSVLNSKLTRLVAWQDEMFEAAKSGEIVIPFFNYTIHFGLITRMLLKDLPKTAVNYPIQGIGSMIMTRAAYLAQPRLAAIGAKIVALVHDDYTIEVAKDRAYEAAQIMAAVIDEAGREVNDRMVWQIEYKVGTQWGSLKELTLDQIKEKFGG